MFTKRSHFIWVWVLIYIPLVWVCSWFMSSTLYQWDMLGHYQASLQFSKELWPSFVGWNSNHFGGFPQGYFYPSLFHWLIGLTQKIVEPELAFKLWVVVSTLLLPWSVDRVGRTLFGESRVKRAGLLICFMFLYFLPKGPAGGDLYSTFRIGLVNQNWALIPFFLFLSEYWKPGSTISVWLRAGFFLGVTLLSHAIVGFVGLLMLAVRFDWKKTWTVTGLAFLVSSAWSVPFLMYREFASGLGIRFLAGLNFIADEDIALPVFAIGVGLLVSVIWLGRKGYSTKDPLIQGAGVLTVLVVFVELIHRFGWFDLQHLVAIHFYRIQGLLAFFWLAPAFIHTLEFSSDRWRRGLWVAMLAVAGFSSYRCAGSDRTDFNIGSGFTSQSRVLVYQGMNSLLALAAPHHLADSLQAQGVKTVNGLFAESSRQSRYYLATLNELFTKPMVWGVELMPYSPRLAKKHIRALGVDGIVSNEPLNAGHKAKLPIQVSEEGVKLEARFSGQTQWEVFNAYLLRNSLVEVLQSPRFIEEKFWKESVYDWWMDEQEEPWLIRARPTNSPGSLAPRSVEPKWKRISSGEILIEDPSPEPHWLLVKESYFPNWRAFDASGQSLPLTEAAPSLMAVHGNGQIRLIFELSLLERLAQFCTWFLLSAFAGWGMVSLVMRLRRLIGVKAVSWMVWPGIALLSAGCAQESPLKKLDADRFVSGSYHACKQKSGEFRCWGINHDGQLGTGSIQSEPFAVRIGEWPEDALGGAAGLSFTCVHDQTEVHCSGRLGDFRSLRPAKLYSGPHRISGLIARHRALCVLFEGARVPPKCFGFLGFEPIEKLKIPESARELSLGVDRLCYLREQSIRCLSSTGKEERIPVYAKGRFQLIGLSVGSNEVCGLLESENRMKLQCHRGQERFEMESPGDPWKKVVSGDGHSCALTRSGEVWCWGDNSKLQADPVSRQTQVEVIATPRKVPRVRGVKDIFAGALHTCLMISGYYSCFGGLGNGVRGL